MTTKPQSDKDRVIDFIRELPDQVDLARIREELEVLTAIREGQADFAAGRIVSHEEMLREIASWNTK